MKLNYQICLHFSILFLLLVSCSKYQKCGYANYNNGLMEFHLCDSFLEKDTIENEGFDMAPTWDEVDSVKFILPKDCKIVDAKFSTLIRPSLWPDYEDNVLQYITFSELDILRSNIKNVEIKGNLILHPMELDNKLTEELYFAKSSGISKSQLQQHLIDYFEEEKKYLNTQVPDSFNTVDNIKNQLLENERTRRVYFKYLRNYTSWRNAPNNNFELLAIAKYLTLSIECKNKIKKITFTHYPVYGN